MPLAELGRPLLAAGLLGPWLQMRGGFPRQSVGVLAFLQRRIVDFAAASKPLVQRGALFFCRIESVLKRLVHLMDTFFLKQEMSETVSPLPEKGTRLSSP